MTGPGVLFEITRQCDRSCPHCYNPDRREASAEDLAAPRIEALLDRLCAADVSEVTIIGGEPLTVPTLPEIVRRFSARDLRVGLSTNALALDSARIEELVGAGVRSFEVSLDSPDPKRHAAITGAAGVEKVRRALVELALCPVDVTVGAVLTQRSVGEIDSLLKLCFAIGVDRLVLAQLAPVGQARACAAQLALSDDGLSEACLLANARSAELGVTVGIGLPVEPCRIDRLPYPNLQFEACRCGKDKWVLEPSGAVRTCELSDVVVGNLLETSLAEIGRSEEVATFRSDTLTAECHECEYWPVCQGGCRFLRPTT